MADLTFAQLQTGLDSGTIFDGMIADLTAAPQPFPVNDWNDGAVPKSQLEVWSLALSRAYKSIAAINNSGFLNLAAPSWIPVLAQNIFGITPFPASFTTGLQQFTVNSGGPYTITGGKFTVATASGLRYFTSNTTPITITSAAPAYIPIIAESPGSAYNVLQGTINKLITSLPGVTVSNVPKAPATTWITDYGIDAETIKQIIQRCQARFGRLSKLQNYPTDGYVSLVRDLVAQIKKVSVFTNYYQGTARPGCATLFVAGDSGPVTPDVVAAVLAAINPYRNPLGTIFVDSCIVANYPVPGTVEVAPDFNFDAVLAAIDDQLLEYQTEAQIGAKIYAARIIENVMLPQGVVNYKYSPALLTDLQLGRNQVINFIPQLTLVPVQT
jgi:hypothetical protein